MRWFCFLCLWCCVANAGQPSLVRTFSFDQRRTPSFSKDEKLLAIVIKDGVQLYDIPAANVVKTLRPGGTDSYQQGFDFSQDGKYLLVLTSEQKVQQEPPFRHTSEATAWVYHYGDILLDTCTPWKEITFGEEPSSNQMSLIGIVGDRYLVLGLGAASHSVSIFKTEDDSVKRYGGKIRVCDLDTGAVTEPTIDLLFEGLEPPTTKKKNKFQKSLILLQWCAYDDRVVAHRVYGQTKKYELHDQQTAITHSTDEVIIRFVDGYPTVELTNRKPLPMRGDVSPDGQKFAGTWFRLLGASKLRSDRRESIIVSKKSDPMFTTLRKVWKPGSKNRIGLGTACGHTYRWTDDSRYLVVGCPAMSKQPRETSITIHTPEGKLLGGIRAIETKAFGVADVSAHGKYVLAVSSRKKRSYKIQHELWDMKPQQ